MIFDGKNRMLTIDKFVLLRAISSVRMEDMAGGALAQETLFMLSSWIRAGKTIFTGNFNVACHRYMRSSARCSDSTHCGSCWKHCFNYLWLKIKYLNLQDSIAPGEASRSLWLDYTERHFWHYSCKITFCSFQLHAGYGLLKHEVSLNISCSYHEHSKQSNTWWHVVGRNKYLLLPDAVTTAADLV